ncbi:MAG: hypothetical protein SH821_02655 [Phototrophicales bacterium]|nr:hypothetical protein [Phototrophicales bacterium]
MDDQDRILVCVINRQRDLRLALDAHWYRIPQARAPRHFVVDYLAFFVSRTARLKKPSGIYAYAPMRGYELQRRRDLLPQEPHHPRADDLYYRIALGDFIEKNPPILNPNHYTVSFILTTGEAFYSAHHVGQLFIPSLDTTPTRAKILVANHFITKDYSDADY